MACASLVFNFLINYGSVVIFPLFIAVGFTLCLPGNLLIGTISTTTHIGTTLKRPPKNAGKQWTEITLKKYKNVEPASLQLECSENLAPPLISQQC